MTVKQLEKEFGDNERLQEFILNLYIRYLDEQEYETIDEYLEPIKQHLPTAIKIVEPFEIICQADDGILKIVADVDDNGFAKILYGII